MVLRRVIAPFLAALAVVLASCSGGSSGGVSQSAPKLYDIVASAVTPPGLQANRPFSVTASFFKPGTTIAHNLDPAETIGVAVASGPGTLAGVVSRPGDGTSALVFNNLYVDKAGTYVLEFTGTRASGPAQTAAFFVNPSMNLHIAVVPTGAIKNRPFTVTLQTVDPVTMAVVAPPSPLQVKLERDPATGSAPLSGPPTVTISSGIASVTTLTYPVAEVIALRASAPGFNTVTSQAFQVDALTVRFAPVPSTVMVNGTFSLKADIVGQVSGLPITPFPALSANVGVSTGAGALSGGTSALSSGSSLHFTGLRYNQLGNATFVLNSLESPPAFTTPVAFGLGMTVSATGPTSLPPTGTFNPFVFRVVDGNGLAWPGALGTLTWTLSDASAGVVQSSATTFVLGAALVTPAPIAVYGNYTLAGSINTPMAASADIGISINNLTFTNEPGPFVALKSCRVGTPYSDSVAYSVSPTALSFGQLSGQLPAGLALNGSNGAITGTPAVAGSYSFTLFASLPGGLAQAIRCALAVFTQNEAEIVPGQTFHAPGPYPVVGPLHEIFVFTSSYDGVSYASTAPANPPWAPCRVECYHPNFAVAPSPAPVFIHHRGRGFNMVDYRALGMHLASYGFIFVSIEDYQSFADGGGATQTNRAGTQTYTATPNQAFDQTNPERGMMSASAFQEAAMQWLAASHAQPGHALNGKVDIDRVFAAGHSRGGGATHASHVRSKPYMFNGTLREGVGLRGVVYFMAFDLRYFQSTSLGSPQVYPVPTLQARLPSLVISAENDGDLMYPICDQFIERASGPTTFATIYGGCHAFLSDSGVLDAFRATITRQQQQARMFNLVVAFLKRWSNLDISLDGLLYNNELATSNQVGVCAWRNMMEATVVDNHQGVNPAFNALGGSNSMAGGSYTTAGNAYPALGHLFTTEVRHNILTITPGANAVYSTAIPAANRDQSRARRIVFRCGAVDVATEPLKGFNWTTIRMRATSGISTTATVTLYDRTVIASDDLPVHISGDSVFDRFVDVSVRLNRFTQANPAFDRANITRLELIFETDGSSGSRQFYFDDLRFE